MIITLEDACQKVKNGTDLNQDEIAGCMDIMMSGNGSSASIADFLIALSDKGETAEEITGAAKVLRSKATTIKAPENAIDCCGTGGDQSGTYNISTAVALLCAAAGVPIAKHGNRAASSKSGAADVLEALDINLDVAHEKLEKSLQDSNFCFLMAPKHHASMRHVGAIRKELGRRTIFNLLGPLANPAGTRFQLIGVFDKSWLKPMAKALHNLGTKRAWLVHGSDGLDEITVTGKTHCVYLKDNGDIEEFILTPADFGLSEHSTCDLKGGDAQQNAAALRGILNGEKNAYRDIVLANAAAVLKIQTPESDLKDNIQKLSQILDSGKATELLNSYAKFTQESL